MNQQALITGLALLCICGVLGCRHNLKDTTTTVHQLPETISYNFHIRPILADRCFSCHGPDEAARKAGLRLDQPESAYAHLQSGRQAIKKGRLKKSEVYHRIYSSDRQIQMPSEH